MKTRIKISLITILLSCTIVFGQRQADVTTAFKQDIQQILLNPLNGHIIVKEKDALSDYNPETKKTEWEIDKNTLVKIGNLEKAQKVLDALGSVAGLAASFQSADDIYFIQGSPYVRSVIESRDIIINSLNGQILFNSGTVDYRIVQSRLLPELNELLLLASDGKNFYYVLWNLEKSEEVWKTELGPVAGMMSMFKDLFSLKNTHTEDKSEIVGDAIYTSLNGILYKLDKSTGKISWQSKDKINRFYLTQTGNDIIIIKNSGSLISSKQALNIWNSKDGAPIWKEDIKTKYIIYLEDWSDRLLIAHNSGFNFYTYADGKKVWKKDAKGNSIKKVIPIGQDYLYIADKEMNLIDKDGQNKWKKFVEICDNEEDPVYFLDVMGNDQVVYLTGSYGNLVNYATGKKIWKKNIDFEKERPVLYALDENTNTFLVYNDKKVYKFDAQSTERPEPIAKLKKVKNEESISDLELFDWGISLAGEGDIIGVGLDGIIKYQNAYDEPGGGKRKFLKASGKIAAIGLGVTAGVTQAELVFSQKNEKGELIETGRANLFDKKTQKTGQVAGAASDLLSSGLLSGLSNRFNAMKSNSEYAFVLAKGANGPVLVKVKKADGTEVDKIDLDNNKPIYEVDPVNDNVYYVYKNELRTFSRK
ncbi:MAG: PQQ-binding-like beta-propeller repeat protein [Candidatus Symbiothrix sp.]|jgi:hypothetical protein|nr:PQQ-binding-like beta-propeller repeat protein [Candidatus Symbiothrix sp.]